MSESKRDPREALLQAISRFDRTFSRGPAAQVAALFSEHARLMWPGTEDFVGREAITAALGEFFGEFTPIAFTPDRQVVELCGTKAFSIGRFIEDVQSKSGGPAQRIHGRIVEMWAQTEKGDWEIASLLTGRYAENETLPSSPGSP